MIEKLLLLLIMSIAIASILIIYIVSLFIPKYKSKELKICHVLNHHIIDEQDAEGLEIENYEKIDNIIFVYHTQKRVRHK